MCLLELILINISNAIYKIHRQIKRQTKKLLIDDLSKRLLGLEFKLNYSIKSMCLKYTVKKYYLQYKT